MLYNTIYYIVKCTYIIEYNLISVGDFIELKIDANIFLFHIC